MKPAHKDQLILDSGRGELRAERQKLERITLTIWTGLLIAGPDLIWFAPPSRKGEVLTQ